MHIHPLVRYTAQTLAAVGCAALGNALLGTTAIVTTSYLTALIAWLVWVLLLVGAACFGWRLAGWACDKVSDDACEGYGASLGRTFGRVTNLFARRA